MTLSCTLPALQAVTESTSTETPPESKSWVCAMLEARRIAMQRPRCGPFILKMQRQWFLTTCSERGVCIDTTMPESVLYVKALDSAAGCVLTAGNGHIALPAAADKTTHATILQAFFKDLPASLIQHRISLIIARVPFPAVAAEDEQAAAELQLSRHFAISAHTAGATADRSTRHSFTTCSSHAFIVVWSKRGYLVPLFGAVNTGHCCCC